MAAFGRVIDSNRSLINYEHLLKCTCFRFNIIQISVKQKGLKNTISAVIYSDILFATFLTQWFRMYKNLMDEKEN